jgi:ubiquinone/menaquinone biosynthesis C-methylase UbiE
MNESAETRISKFYNTEGWREVNGNTEDANRFEDLRKYSREYVSKCRLRLLKFIPQKGEHILDMASGPIQYPEYLKYSEGYLKRHCVDLSLDALNIARKKIGIHGEYHHGSFFDLPFETNFFDCSLSVHTIYHMDKEMQSFAVRKLIDITKKNCPVIIIYSNPNSIVNYFTKSFVAKLLRKFKVRQSSQNFGKTVLYFHAHDLSWWNQFQDLAEIKIYPWRSFDSDYQKRLFPDNFIGKFMFRLLFRLEDSFPFFFAKFFQYPIIVLTKK